MGGIIEDKIFELCDFDKHSVREVTEGLRGPKISCEREYGTVDKHMRKMVQVQQLTREIGPKGVYVYWNPRTINDPK